MTELFKLDFIEAKKQDSAAPRVRLVAQAYPSDERGFVFLTEAFAEIEQFDQAVEGLKAQMDTLVAKAREAFQPYHAEQDVETREFQTVEEIWQAMEMCENLQDMQEIFNDIELDKRREVANFVLTHVNSFKGAGAIFSQHYNEQGSLLEWNIKNP